MIPGLLNKTSGEENAPSALPTPEEQKAMLEYLKMLDELKDKDPAKFAEAMGALGLPSGPQTNENTAENPFMGNNASVSALASEVEKMRLNSGSAASPSSSSSDIGGGDGIGNLAMPGQKRPEDQPGMDITPKPGFVLKTKRESDGLKVFVNICVHEELAKPGLKKRLDPDGNEVEGINVPLSVGPPRVGNDKEGKECVVFDMIVNPQVVEECRQNDGGKYKDFICQMGIQCVEGKFNMELDKRYKLPKLHYMGEPVSQRIQDRKKMPSIEEVKPGGSAAKGGQRRVAKKAVVVEELRPLIQLVGGAVWSSGEALAGECWDGQYVEPVRKVPDGAVSIQVSTVVSLENLVTNELKTSDVGVAISPYKLQLTLPDHKPLVLALPAPVRPGEVFCRLSRPNGSTRRVALTVTLPLDLSPVEEVVDAGSKQWLVAQALRSEHDRTSPYEDPEDGGGGKDDDDNGNEDDGDTLPEDRFHLKLPDNVDQYTGVPHEEAGEEELPEERFHRADAGSSFHIQQREQSVKDKWDKHEREKAEREQAKDDPNIEYIDVDDFKPGGKYGPKRGDKPRVEELTPEQAAAEAEQAEQAELAKAAEVVRVKAAAKMAESGLSSSMYTELL